MNIDFMGLLTIFVSSVNYISVVIWIIDKKKWGLEVGGLSPLILFGLLYGVCLTIFSFFYELLKLPVELAFLVIFIAFPIISFFISVKIVKGVWIKNNNGVIIAFISFFVLNLLTFVLGYPIQILLLVAYIIILVVMWRNDRKSKRSL